MISLEEIRKKPPATKQRIAFLTALILTGVIASGWLVSLSLQARAVTPNTNDQSTVQAGPIQGIMNGFRRAFDGVKNIEFKGL